jgi:hypothetical protein
MKFYTIELEERNERHRFRSLYNSCIGSWRVHKADAIEDGEKHKALILALHIPKEPERWVKE